MLIASLQAAQGSANSTLGLIIVSIVLGVPGVWLIWAAMPKKGSSQDQTDDSSE